MGKGSSGTNTVVQNSAPPADVTAQYNQVIGQANQTAATPYTTGGFNASNMIAGFSPDQYSAFNTVDQSQGIQQPYLAAGQADLNASQTPLWNGVQQYSPSTMAQYANPYLNQAVGATEAQIQNTNAQQQNQVMGNAISSGAWGGDRSAIAQSELANQQALAENQTISGMENTGFNQQQGEFNTQQQAQLGANEANAWLGSQGAALESGLGTTAQSTALNGATAQYNMGLNQQQLAQSQLNVPYEQFQAQQAYPFQTGSWLSNISEGIGGSEGGVGTTTSPAPNALSQDIGTAAGAGTLGYLGYMANQALPAGYGAVAGASSLGIKRGGAVHRASGGFTPQNFDNGGGAGGATPGYLPLSAFESSAPPSVGTVNVGTPNMGRGSMGPPAIKNSTGSNSTTTGGQPQGGGVNGLITAMQLGKFAPSGGYAGVEPSVQAMQNGFAPGAMGSGINETGATGIDLSPSAAEGAGLGSFGSGMAAPVGDFGSGAGAGVADAMSSAGLGAGIAPTVSAGAAGAGIDAMAANAGADAMAAADASPLLLAGLKRGGFVPKHYDGGGGIGLPTAQQTGASPGAANVANQFQNMTVEQLQQLNARSMGRNPQIQMALQRKQMTGGAAQQPQQAGIAPMAAQAQGAAPPAQAAAVPSGAQPENIMQQNGFARGGMPRHYDTGGGDNTPLPDPNGDASSGLGGNPQLQGMSPIETQALLNINRSAPPISGGGGNNSQGLTPQLAAGQAPLPSHDDFMANYNKEVMNQAPYNKPDPIMALLDTMGRIGAGRNSKFGVNAGQGAAEGIQDWANTNKEAAAESERRGTLQEQGESMYQKMVDARNDMNLRNEQLAQTGKYQQGELGLRQQELTMGKNEIVKDMFGNPTGTYNKITNQFTPLDGAAGGPNSGNNVPKDVDGTPLTPFQLYSYKNLITKQQPKDIAAQNALLPSLIDQKTKVDDMVNQIPIASSGDLHTLQDFADRNKVPVFSDPERANATVLQNYDSMGNVIDNVRTSFAGTGRVLAKEFEGLQNELSVNKSASPEQKAVVVAHIQSKLNDLIQNEQQRTADIRNGKAYLPSYQSPEQQRLAASKPGMAPASAAGTPPSGSKLIGTSGGKSVYQLPDGSKIVEQ